MMWKDTYCLGVAQIDNQHKELFQLVENLIETMDADPCPRVQLSSAVDFLKKYVHNHFRDEETYQEFIHYPHIEEHKKQHRLFGKTVIEYEKKFQETCYDVNVIKSFTGVLIAWLIYHVMNEDLKIAKGELAQSDDHLSVQTKSVLDCFATSVSHVFETMFEIKTNHLSQSQPPIFQDDAIHAKIEFVGEFAGEIIYSFPKKFASHVMLAMTGMQLHEMDHILHSAMAEISNIISGNAATELVRQGQECDIRPPVMSIGSIPFNNALLDRHTLGITTDFGDVFITVTR